jgi:hypothetical protein
VVGRVVAPFAGVSSGIGEIDEIVAADRAASREIDGVKETLAARLQAERARLDEEHAAGLRAARQRADDEAARLEREGQARLDTRRRARAAEREAVRARAAAALPEAIAAYVAIVKGEGSGGGAA